MMDRLRLESRRWPWFVSLAAAALVLGCDDDGGGGGGGDAGPDAECVAGDEGCPCLEDNTCHLLDGEPLACINGTCQQPDDPTPGQINSACDENIECGLFENDPLTCVGGTCQLADCLSGVTNCPCGPVGACDADGAACVDDFCRIEDCELGTPGCACDQGQCQGDLQCIEGFCEEGVSAALDISSADARACEVLLQDPEDRVAGVRFGSAATGVDVRRGQRVALAFHANADEAFAAGAVSLLLATSDAGEIADVDVDVVNCFDATGRAIDGVTITLVP